MNTPEPGELAHPPTTEQLQPPGALPAPETSPPPAPPVTEPSVNGEAAEPTGAVEPVRPGVTYVPLAVTVGDGFKLGCGFFMALVLVMLIGFVLLAALFAITSLVGLNLPLAR